MLVSCGTVKRTSGVSGNKTVVEEKDPITPQIAPTYITPGILLLWGSYPPTVGSKVGLNKGFDTDKAPDTPSGRVDDVVGGNGRYAVCQDRIVPFEDF